MSRQYFSERQLGPPPRISEEINEAVWGGIFVLVRALIDDGSFGAQHPLECPDGYGVVATDERRFALALGAEIPGFPWPMSEREIPPTLLVLDLIEFCFGKVAGRIEGQFHSYFGHYHLSFDREAGQASFRENVNRIFSRNGLAYELGENGQITRLAPPALQELLSGCAFKTGDATLDSMLEEARRKFLDPDPVVRRESLERLWDCWERLKTLEAGRDKKSSVTLLLDKGASEPNFRRMIEGEAMALTQIGNSFQIRHSETSQVPLERSEHVDYLFHRLFALIHMLIVMRTLKTTDSERF